MIRFCGLEPLDTGFDARRRFPLSLFQRFRAPMSGAWPRLSISPTAPRARRRQFVAVQPVREAVFDQQLPSQCGKRMLLRLEAGDSLGQNGSRRLRAHFPIVQFHRRIRSRGGFGRSARSLEVWAGSGTLASPRCSPVRRPAGRELGNPAPQSVETQG